MVVHTCKEPTRCDECWNRIQEQLEALEAQLQQAQEKLERYEEDAHAEAAHAACVSRDVATQARLAKAIERYRAASDARKDAVEEACEARCKMDGWAIAMRQANRITAELRQRAEAAEALVAKCKLPLRESALMLRAAANEAQRLRQDDDAKALRRTAEFAHRTSLMTPTEALAQRGGNDARHAR